ncbi:MAG: hypothetical protein ABIZ18_02495, partial [Caldimonas sp.]
IVSLDPPAGPDHDGQAFGMSMDDVTATRSTLRVPRDVLAASCPAIFKTHHHEHRSPTLRQPQ